MIDERTRIASARAPIDPATVVGWGADANPENDPTYPQRDRSADAGLATNWQRPTAQESEVEVLQSMEYVHRPAVFGTASPPSGLSGVMRRGAFRWSESNWLHWLILMGADRVNVVEGILQDVARGKIPNIPAEMGLRSELRHNKAGFAQKVAVTAALSAGLYLLLKRRGSDGPARTTGAGDRA